MNIKKIVSAVSALTIAASMFSAFAVAANAAQEDLYTMTCTVETTELSEWTVAARGDQSITYGDNSVTINDGRSNNLYFAYASGNIADTTNGVYCYEFDYKTNTGGATGNNASSIATWNSDTNLHYNQFGSSQSSSALGMTDTNTTYAVKIIIDNTAKKATYMVNNEVKTVMGLSGTNRGVIFRPGRTKTDTISNFKAYEVTSNFTFTEVLEVLNNKTLKVTVNDKEGSMSLADTTEVSGAGSAKLALVIAGVPYVYTETEGAWTVTDSAVTAVIE